MQDQDQDSGNRRHQEKTPIKDEFTEFSQYGSRFWENILKKLFKKNILLFQVHAQPGRGEEEGEKFCWANTR